MLTLHHYPGSPYAEKVRTLLGYKQLPWCSVEVPPVPPRASLQPVLGAFRRTPVLQIGADYFCDTRLIAEVLDRLAPEPPLHPPPARALAELVSQWVEPRVFVMLGPLRFRSADDVGGTSGGSVDARAFARDRGPFMAPVIDTRRFDELRDSAADHARRFVGTLAMLLADSGGGFLCGSRPTLADFSAYHLVWWLRRPPARDEVLVPHPEVAAWAERMAAIGHGRATPLAAEAALARARDGQGHAAWAPPWPERPDARRGRPVTVTSDDYGRDAIEGTLTSSTQRHLTVERRVPSIGTVRVHFPTLGYEVVSALR